MNTSTKNKSTTKKWNVTLKVSPQEEQTIKIGAIKKGMSVAEYLKKLVLDDLSTSNISTLSKKKQSSLKG